MGMRLASDTKHCSSNEAQQAEALFQGQNVLSLRYNTFSPFHNAPLCSGVKRGMK